MDQGRSSLAVLLHGQDDSHALLNIKNIFILSAIRGFFFLLRIAVQVVYVNLAEALHEALAHATEGRIIEIAVIGDETKDAVTGSINPPLREANEFDVIILEPLGVFLTEGRTVYDLVILDQIAYESLFLDRLSCLGLEHFGNLILP